jgi:hypothetical protein
VTKVHNTETQTLSLALLRRVNAVNADLALAVVAVEHRYGVAIAGAHDPPGNDPDVGRRSDVRCKR